MSTPNSHFSILNVPIKRIQSQAGLSYVERKELHA